MNITGSTQIKPLAMNTVEDFRSTLKNAGADADEVNSLIEFFSGQSNFTKSIGNNIYQPGQKIETSDVGNCRNKMLSIFFNMFRDTFSPISEAINAEAKEKADADLKKRQDEYDAKPSHRGRRPGSSNSPTSMISTAVAGSKTKARAELNLSGRGRIGSDNKNKYEKAICKHFREALKNLKAENPEGFKAATSGHTSSELIEEHLGITLQNGKPVSKKAKSETPPAQDEAPTETPEVEVAETTEVEVTETPEVEVAETTEVTEPAEV